MLVLYNDIGARGELLEMVRATDDQVVTIYDGVLSCGSVTTPVEMWPRSVAERREEFARKGPLRNRSPNVSRFKASRSRTR
jgi:hypothetical protein